MFVSYFLNRWCFIPETFVFMNNLLIYLRTNVFHSHANFALSIIAKTAVLWFYGFMGIDLAA